MPRASSHPRQPHPIPFSLPLAVQIIHLPPKKIIPNSRQPGPIRFAKFPTALDLGRMTKTQEKPKAHQSSLPRALRSSHPAENGSRSSVPRSHSPEAHPPLSPLPPVKTDAHGPAPEASPRLPISASPTLPTTSGSVQVQNIGDGAGSEHG